MSSSPCHPRVYTRLRPQHKRYVLFLTSLLFNSLPPELELADRKLQSVSICSTQLCFTVHYSQEVSIDCLVLGRIQISPGITCHFLSGFSLQALHCHSMKSQVWTLFWFFICSWLTLVAKQKIRLISWNTVKSKWGCQLLQIGYLLISSQNGRRFSFQDFAVIWPCEQKQWVQAHLAEWVPDRAFQPQSHLVWAQYSPRTSCFFITHSLLVDYFIYYWRCYTNTSLWRQGLLLLSAKLYWIREIPALAQPFILHSPSSKACEGVWLCVFCYSIPSPQTQKDIPGITPAI